MKNPSKNNSDLNQQADEIVALLDSLVNSGSQHINLNIGEETKIQTVNSTDCSNKLGACAIPNFEDNENDEEDF
ncbi:MAG: hypothetical protein K2G88_10720 [Oscillospiraceae bacterium]|nr:hypothetical protein [Oscillospiraceae bacterium]